jgi:hypothetical protein
VFHRGRVLSGSVEKLALGDQQRHVLFQQGFRPMFLELS